jgi:hypothetical protein
MPHYITTEPKQVRFAYKLNIFHSPPPPEASALPFSSTIPSSSRPIIPPSVTRSTPYVPPYPPAKSTMPSSRYAMSVRPHSYLDMSGVTWDLRDHQSTASRKHHSISSRALCEPATNPPLPFFTISSYRLPWTIKVYASNNSFVTVEDVLSSIYHSLRFNLTPLEFNTFAPTDQRRATRAYKQRYERQRSVRVYEKEKYGGMKRVDFLRGHTQFLGISNDGRRFEQWHLHVT